MTESNTDLGQIIARVLANPPDRMRPVLLAGPTASGKSALALALAQVQGRVIVNADALQVWNMWRILTARPDAADEALVSHLLYGCVAGGQNWSVGHWLRAVINILAQHPNAVIVGGTGLYFRALTEGLVEIPPVPTAIRADADARMALHGVQALLAELDHETAAQIDTANPARIQRAWEVLQATGRGLADWQADTPPPVLPLHKATAYVMRPPVPWLDARIASRFDAMLQSGALEEVRAVLPNWQATAPWAKAIGAPELIAHLQGHMSLSDARAAATLATRQYAKRQRTWFRARMGAWTPLD
jgi:tRNA dimethylallyltransferase